MVLKLISIKTCLKITFLKKNFFHEGKIVPKLILSSLFIFLLFTGFSHACERLASFYLDSEVILNSGARSLGVKVIDARAVKSKDFKSFYFVQYKMSTPNNGMVYPMFAMNKPQSRGGVIYSMDDLAITLSGYGDGRKTKAKFSSRDDGYDRAMSCLK